MAAARRHDVHGQLTSRKSYGHAPTLDEAKAAFRVEYEAWKGPNGQQAGKALKRI